MARNTAPKLPLGPIMTSLDGPELTAEDREVLCHPLIGGVIYFGKNYVDKAQLTELSKQIKALRSPELVIAVDHEGGRVQRDPADAIAGRFVDNASAVRTCARVRNRLYDRS
jgi:beta-glucosidase-like glycosyl hydrolase